MAIIKPSTRLILHIGQPKTGTTYLQGVLAKSRKDLLKHGILYPKIGLSRENHNPLSIVARDGCDMPRSFRSKFRNKCAKLNRKIDADYNPIQAQIESKRPCIAIISGESFYAASLAKNASQLKNTRVRKYSVDAVR